MASATPPIDFYLGAWIGQGRLAFALVTPDATWRRLDGALRGWVFGTAVNVVVLRFVPHTIVKFTDLPSALGWLALVLLAAFEGLSWAWAGWLTRKLIDRSVPTFVAFGIAVWTSTFAPTVFAWTVGAGLSPLRPLVQLADVIGERGVTALLAVSSALAAEAFRATRRIGVVRAGLAALLPILMSAYGLMRIRAIDRARADAPTARVALVQPSTEARMRWDPRAADGIVQRLAALTKTAEQRGTDLVVWPEAAYPYTMHAESRADLMGAWAVLQPGVRGPVLTGLLMRTKDGAGSYNSATIVHGGRVDPPYHKMHLLAFGEAVPFAGTFPILRRIFARGTGLIPGDHQVLLTSGAIRAAVLDCFEDTLPEAGREAAAVDPNLLVNVTNDAWFAGSEESELHLRLARMRAIEVRRDLVRAVNMGLTSWVDATGRIRGRFDPTFAGSLSTEPALLEGETPYARFGDLGAGLLLALMSLAGWFGYRTKNERRAV